MLASVIKAMADGGYSAAQIASVALYLDHGEPLAPIAPEQRTARQERNARHYQMRKERLKTSEIKTLHIEDSESESKKESIYSDCDYEEFALAFPKRPDGAWNAKDNRRAYDAAIAAGAGPAALTISARAYRDQRAALAARDPKQAKYTLTLASWLDRELWREPRIALATTSPIVDATEYVLKTDPRWSTLEARWRLERGHGLNVNKGWSFSRAWVEAA